MEEEKLAGGYFYIIPVEIAENKAIPNAGKWLYGLISSLTNKNGYCNASNKWLSKKLDVGEDYISSMLIKLEEEGWLEISNKQSKWRKILLRFSKSTLEKSQKYSLEKSRVHNSSKVSSKVSNNIYASLEFLEKIPEQDLEKFKSDFNLSDVIVKFQGQKAADWCRSKGRRQKDYKAFFRNWLRNYGEFNKDKAPNKQFQAENTSKYDKYIKS